MCELCRMLEDSYQARDIQFVQDPSSEYYVIKIDGKIIPPEPILESLKSYQEILIGYAKEQLKQTIIDHQLDNMVSRVIQEIGETLGMNITQDDIDGFRAAMENIEDLSSEQVEELTEDFFKKAQEQT